MKFFVFLHLLLVASFVLCENETQEDFTQTTEAGETSKDVEIEVDLDKKLNNEDLNLNISTKLLSPENPCSIFEVKTCFSVNVQPKIAILEVSVPPKYYFLLEGSLLTPEYRKSSYNLNKVTLRFSISTSEEICSLFYVTKLPTVEVKGAIIAKIYDYLDPKVSISQSHKLPECF